MLRLLGLWCMLMMGMLVMMWMLPLWLMRLLYMYMMVMWKLLRVTSWHEHCWTTRDWLCQIGVYGSECWGRCIQLAMLRGWVSAGLGVQDVPELLAW